MMSGLVSSQEIERFVDEVGNEVKSDPEYSVHEVPSGYFSSLMHKHDSSVSAAKGVEHLPEIAVIGLVSVYDAHIVKLLECVYDIHPELIFTSEKEIKFSSLIEYDSIEDVKNSIISKEIESVLRNSHHDQFSWMESKFKMKLKEGLDVWPEFVELCERRNLLTHTGGVVSEQYLRNCRDHGYRSSATVGDKLNTDVKYFVRAVQIISEVGLKLGHVLWRKFLESERRKADGNLNECSLNLISKREYIVAEELLKLGTSFKKHGSDEVRRMMIINYANAIRLGGNATKAKSIIAKEDWSATGLNFRVCAAAVREDLDEVCQLMRACGAEGGIRSEDYRVWPVFRGLRTMERFQQAFLDVFGEPLLRDKKLQLPSEQMETP